MEDGESTIGLSALSRAKLRMANLTCQRRREAGHSQLLSAGLYSGAISRTILATSPTLTAAWYATN